MKTALTIDGKAIEITTDHAASSYSQPVVLVDGELTNVPAAHEADECGCNVLDMLADAAGVWTGPASRRALHSLAAEMFSGPLTGADYDAVIAEFKRRGEQEE